MDEEPPAKKQMLEEKNITSVQEEIDFSEFTIDQVLLNDVKSKRVHVLGKFKTSDDDAIVTLVKVPFSDETLCNILSSNSKFTETFRNDVYGQFCALAKPEHNPITTQIIHPATEKHKLKYSAQNMYFVYETAEDYKNITLPFLEKQQFKIEWVYNILEHKKEVERIIYEDSDETNGFILMPDIKWDGKQMGDLYVIAICHKHGIKSLRDLDETHLPLLKNILENGMRVIKEKYGVPSKEIRAYFHYYPSYYHLHVHFNHIKYDVGGIHVGKAHLLSEVIDNIENIDNKFYQKKTLGVEIKERDPLLPLLLKTT